MFLLLNAASHLLARLPLNQFMQVPDQHQAADPSVQAACELLADIDAEEEDITGKIVFLCHSSTTFSYRQSNSDKNPKTIS